MVLVAPESLEGRARTGGAIDAVATPAAFGSPYPFAQFHRVLVVDLNLFLLHPIQKALHRWVNKELGEHLRMARAAVLGAEDVVLFDLVAERPGLEPDLRVSARYHVLLRAQCRDVKA